jgi:hypothetical protein
MMVPKPFIGSPSLGNPIGMGKVPLMTIMTLMTMNCRGSLKALQLSPKPRDHR